MLIKRSKINELKNFLEKLKDKKFNINTQYKLLKINKILEEEQEIFNEQLSIIMKEYGERDDKGYLIENDQGAIKIKEEKLEDCFKEVNQLNSYEIQIQDIFFTLDELEKLNLSLGELILLEPFIKN